MSHKTRTDLINSIYCGRLQSRSTSSSSSNVLDVPPARLRSFAACGLESRLFARPRHDTIYETGSKRERVRFEGGTGLDLSGILEHPVGKIVASVLICHPFTSSKDLRGIVGIARNLAEAGFLVLRFDFTGLGMSRGRFANTNLMTNLSDVEAARSFLKQRSGDARQLLIGLSLGGVACLASAAKTFADAVVPINTPSDPIHVLEHLSEYVEKVEIYGQAMVPIAGRKMLITKQLIENLRDFPMAEIVSQINSAKLVLHAANDDTVELSEGQKLYEALSQPKKLVVLEDADHLISRESDQVHVAAVIKEWFEDLPLSH